MNNFNRLNRMGIFGLSNLQDRPVPLFNLRKEDRKDIEYIHKASLFCVIISIMALPIYIIGVVCFITGLELWIANLYPVSGPVNQSYLSGMLALWIIGLIFILSMLIIRLVRMLYEWRIAKRNNTLLKYYTKLDNSIVSRYMYVCQKSPYLLWYILNYMFWGTIIDFWLIKETKRILDLKPISEEEEKQLQDQWINDFVKTNSTDARIQNAYNNYLQQNNLSNSINQQPELLNSSNPDKKEESKNNINTSSVNEKTTKTEKDSNESTDKKEDTKLN